MRSAQFKEVAKLKPYIIAVGTKVIMCGHLDHDDALTHWFQVPCRGLDSGTQWLALCVECAERFTERSELPDKLLVCVMLAERHPKMPTIQ